MVGLIYFVVVFCANAVGAISGMGGGILIKPIFDALGFHSVLEISFYSSVAVFTMSLVSTTQQYLNHVPIRMKPAVCLSISSIVGGALGNALFENLLALFENDQNVQLIQIVLMVVMLIVILLFTKGNVRSLGMTSVFWYFFAGLFLGFLSSLLGIGGGPLNVMLIVWLFSFTFKEATIYSIIIIFFSQLAKLVMTGISVGYTSFDLTILLWIIPAAILGGAVGGKLNHVFSEQRVLVIYRGVILLVLGLNLVNGWQILLQ
ncbi:sulfite exporter TauE/SafE family protein [Listeria costaricensis]|uniref:sulfite exporter TauE/SafE family protein n=1 Tax=Listeria costaricensis TaxID=2026604 RepID=UPI000C0775E9|nr:sulfite exporter TauE/SafE family protein [Listeria costaricensis]